MRGKQRYAFGFEAIVNFPFNPRAERACSLKAAKLTDIKHFEAEKLSFFNIRFDSRTIKSDRLIKNLKSEKNIDTHKEINYIHFNFQFVTDDLLNPFGIFPKMPIKNLQIVIICRFLMRFNESFFCLEKQRASGR